MVLIATLVCEISLCTANLQLCITSHRSMCFSASECRPKYWKQSMLYQYQKKGSDLTYWGRDEMAATLADDIFKWISLIKMCGFRLKFHWSFFLRFRINNIPAFAQIVAWRWPGDKPLSVPTMVSFVTHICVIRPQLVKHNTSLHSHYICL